MVILNSARKQEVAGSNPPRAAMKNIFTKIVFLIYFLFTMSLIQFTRYLVVYFLQNYNLVLSQIFKSHLCTCSYKAIHAILVLYIVLNQLVLLSSNY